MDYSELKVIKAQLTQEELLFWVLFVFASPFNCLKEFRYRAYWGFSSGSDTEESFVIQESQVQCLGWEDPLEKGMAINILAWRIPWTEDPGGLQSMGLQRVRHN